MSLKDYTGPSNSPEILPYLVGERVAGAYFDSDHHLCLVVESGVALVLGTQGAARSSPPVYWKKPAGEVQADIRRLKAEIARLEGATRELVALEGKIAAPPPPLPSEMERQEWLGRVSRKTAVITAPTLGDRDYSAAARRDRRPGQPGIVVGYSDSHGLSMEVIHSDGTHAFYDPDELTVVGDLSPAPVVTGGTGGITELVGARRIPLVKGLAWWQRQLGAEVRVGKLSPRSWDYDANRREGASGHIRNVGAEVDSGRAVLQVEHHDETVALYTEDELVVIP